MAAGPSSGFLSSATGTNGFYPECGGRDSPHSHRGYDLLLLHSAHCSLGRLSMVLPRGAGWHAGRDRS